jgi:hypothetical protein
MTIPTNSESSPISFNAAGKTYSLNPGIII